MARRTRRRLSTLTTCVCHPQKGFLERFSSYCEIFPPHHKAHACTSPMASEQTRPTQAVSLGGLGGLRRVASSRQTLVLNMRRRGARGRTEHGVATYCMTRKRPRTGSLHRRGHPCATPRTHSYRPRPSRGGLPEVRQM